MKLTKMIALALMTAGLQFAGTALGQSSGVFDCEFKAIAPEGADFFTRGFRAAPTIGTKVQIDFSSPAITSMVFADGRVFFAEGEATLTRLKAVGGPSSGFGGVRLGNEGFYIGYLFPDFTAPSSPEVFHNKFTITQAFQVEDFHLETIATHHADLECRLAPSRMQ